MIWIILGLIAYIFLGAVVGGAFWMQQVKDCWRCQDKYADCYRWHREQAIAAGAFWPVSLIMFGGMLLAATLIRLPEAREQKRLAAEKKNRETIAYLESQGVHADWTKQV